MKPLFIILAFLAWTALPMEAELPSQLRASIATPFTGTATIELGGNTLTYTLRNNKGTETATFNPTKEQWKEFRAILDDVKVWRWRNRYTPRPNGGEAQWSLDIEYRGRRLHSSGAAAWPDEKGSPRPQPTAAFLKYQKAIEKLPGLLGTLMGGGETAGYSAARAADTNSDVPVGSANSRFGLRP